MQMPARIAVAAVLAFGYVATGSAQAATGTWTVELEAAQRRYPVVGGTAAELHDALGRYASHEGHGRTHLDLTLDYDLLEGPDGCDVVRRLIHARITVSLPEWSPPRDASEELVRQWTRAHAILRRHEEGHRQLAVAGVGELRRRLERLPPRRDCREARKAINALLTREATKLQYRNDRFDTRTRGGLRDDPLQPDDGR